MNKNKFVILSSLTTIMVSVVLMFSTWRHVTKNELILVQNEVIQKQDELLILLRKSNKILELRTKLLEGFLEIEPPKHGPLTLAE